MTITFLAPDGVATSAQRERQAKAAQHGGGSGRQLGGRSGFRVGTPSNVLTATSTTWTLTPCSAMIDPGASTHQGMYGWSSDANETGPVTAADATYARKDIVYIQVNDSSAGDGSGATTAPVLYLAGTPAATPVAPTLPARSFLVGTISVPVAGGGSPTVVLNPAVFVGAGAVLPIFSLAERDALTKYDSLTVRRMDLTGFPLETCRAGAWGPEAGAQGLQHEGVVTAGSGGFTTLTVVNNIPTFTFKAGRRYEIVWDGHYQSTAAGDYLDLSIQTCSTADTAILTTGLTLKRQKTFRCNAANLLEPHVIKAPVTFTTDTTLQVKFLGARGAGTGSGSITGSAVTTILYQIIDMGAWI